jgi:hypothetical protein
LGITRHALAVLVAWLAGIETAAAHAGEGAEILLLPTGLYIIGGALAVAVSFCVLALFHRQRRKAGARPERVTHVVPRPVVRLASLVNLIVLIILITAGLTGKPDPLANPLPLAIWTLWWMSFTLLVVIAGNLWTFVNPWIGLYDLIGGRALLAYPERLGYLPAALLFFGFTWFELISVTPQDPGRLAIVVAAYWLLNIVALLIFGPRWLERGEAFSVFFAMAGHFSPLHWRMIVEQGRPQITLRLGGREETDRHDFTDLTGVLFILVTLASVTFDGLSRTFSWVGWLGLNPLEFPGRSAVLWQNSAGLILCIVALGALYVLAVELGPYGTRLVASRSRALGSFVVSLVPISIAYHLAHYLPSLIVGFPSALLALADPFGRGWSWWPHDMVHAGSGMGLGYDMVILIYRVQTSIIVIGHIVATLTAHRLALAETKDRLKAVTSEIPLAVLMVSYTLLGLWLLSTPQIG